MKQTEPKRFERVVEDSEDFYVVVFAIISMISIAFFPWFLNMFTLHGVDVPVEWTGFLNVLGVILLGTFYLVAIIIWGVLFNSAWDKRNVYWRERE